MAKAKPAENTDPAAPEIEVPATSMLNCNDVSIEVSCPFEVGQPMTAVHVLTLWQTVKENVGNANRAKLKKMVEEGKSEAEMQTLLSEAYNAYELGRPRASGASQTPVDRMAITLARKVLVDKLKREEGKTLKAYRAEIGEDAYEEKLAEFAANPAVREAATIQVQQAEAQRASLAAAVK